jgi:hypothetical protein
LLTSTWRPPNTARPILLAAAGDQRGPPGRPRLDAVTSTPPPSRSRRRASSPTSDDER